MARPVIPAVGMGVAHLLVYRPRVGSTICPARTQGMTVVRFLLLNMFEVVALTTVWTHFLVSTRLCARCCGQYINDDVCQSCWIRSWDRGNALSA
jgi:hypothetical protein